MAQSMFSEKFYYTSCKVGEGKKNRKKKHTQRKKMKNSKSKKRLRRKRRKVVVESVSVVCQVGSKIDDYLVNPMADTHTSWVNPVQ